MAFDLNKLIIKKILLKPEEFSKITRKRPTTLKNSNHNETDFFQMPQISAGNNQNTIEIGAAEETESHATESRQKSSSSLPSNEAGIVMSTLQQRMLDRTQTEVKELAGDAFEKLEDLIHQYTEEKNILKLREIENFIVKWQKFVQEQYKKLISNSEGEQIQPDGKISFEEMNKIVAGKRYSYTRMYWKEAGIKKGKVLRIEPENKNEE